ADAIVITRCEASDLAPGIESEARRWNPRAPIFRARVEPDAWVDNRTGKRQKTLKHKHVGMFCGLGNPRSFRYTLEGMGIEIVEAVEFEDHHRYRPAEVRNLVRMFQDKGAEALVIMEKDAVNLCEDIDELLGTLPLYWLKVGMRFEQESELLRTI